MLAPYRILSLWDMLQLPIGRLLATFQNLVSTSQMFSMALSQQQKQCALTKHGYDELLDAADEFCRLCLDISLVVSHESAKLVCSDLRRVIDVNSMVLFDISALLRVESSLKQLIGCVRCEAITKIAMILPPEKLALYEPKEPVFGADVHSKFPSLIYDIEESSKCLALGRTTASAFHSIRSLEGGITAISRCLAIPDPTKGADRNWGALLGKIKIEIDRRWSGGSSRFSGDGAIFEGLYGVLQAVQNPYRNATMHLDNKYLEDDAKHIFEMVSGIMRKIASRMDELGQPYA